MNENTQYDNYNTNNSWITFAAIVAATAFGMYTVKQHTKYGRSINISFNDFSITSLPASPAITTPATI